MLISEAYKVLRVFCLRALGDNNFNITAANQNAPRIKKPFITIDIDNCKEVSTFNEFIDEEGAKTFEIQKTIDVTFNAYTDELFAAEDYLTRIYNMLATELTFEVFGRSLAYLHKLQDVRTASVTVSDKIENRTLMQLRFNIMQTAQFNTGIIEHVEITDKITNSNYTI